MPVAINVTTYVTDCGCFWKLIAFLTENGTGPVIVIARKVQEKRVYDQNGRWDNIVRAHIVACGSIKVGSIISNSKNMF
jgi:hypothetical protein